MALARVDTLQQDRLVGTEVDEVNADIGVVVGRDTHDVSVFMFESGTGDDDTFGEGGGVWRRCGETGDGCFAEEDQPVPSICVGEGNVLGHFVFVGLGVVLFKEKVLAHGDIGSNCRVRLLTSSPSM